MRAMKAQVRLGSLFRAIKRAGCAMGCCALAVGLTAASGGQVPAQAASSTSMTSGVQVQNLSSTDTANVQLVYYNPDGTTAATQGDLIPARPIKDLLWWDHGRAGWIFRICCRHSRSAGSRHHEPCRVLKYPERTWAAKPTTAW